jgi:dephospho-CoA kinase
MFLIGLTGGIAAGKSTVAKHWVSLGAIEIDADVLAREVVVAGTPGAQKIKSLFGEHLFDSAGNLDRKALADVVFQNPEKLKELESIVHPLVRSRAAELLSSLPSSAMVIYTVPLLVEAQVALPFDAIVSVEAPEAERVRRLVSSRGMSEDQAKARIKSQATPLERAARADYILNSNQAMSSLLGDADNLWHKFQVQAQGKLE